MSSELYVHLQAEVHKVQRFKFICIPCLFPLDEAQRTYVSTEQMRIGINFSVGQFHVCIVHNHQNMVLP